MFVLNRKFYCLFFLNEISNSAVLHPNRSHSLNSKSRVSLSQTKSAAARDSHVMFPFLFLLLHEHQCRHMVSWTSNLIPSPSVCWQIFGWICLIEPCYSLSLGCLYVLVAARGKGEVENGTVFLMTIQTQDDWKEGEALFCVPLVLAVWSWFLSSWFWCTESV